jgi:hypothetical protein
MAGRNFLIGCEFSRQVIQEIIARVLGLEGIPMERKRVG